jgi:hypothetical protein
MYAQGRHAFIAPGRGPAMSCVTTRADLQIVDVAPRRRTGVLAIEIV